MQSPFVIDLIPSNLVPFLDAACSTSSMEEMDSTCLLLNPDICGFWGIALAEMLNLLVGVSRDQNDAANIKKRPGQLSDAGGKLA